MTATDAQVRIIMREREKGRTQEQAAASANLSSRKTAARYERLGQLPSALKRPRTYRTRADAFAEEWPVVEEMLVAAPELEAKALFEWLCEQHSTISSNATPVTSATARRAASAADSIMYTRSSANSSRVLPE